MQKLMAAFAVLCTRGEELATMLGHDEPPTESQLAMKRMALSAAVRAYLAEEHRAIIAPLMRIGSPPARTLAETFNSETNRLRNLYSKHVVAWPTAVVAEDWTRYRTESRGLIAQLRRVNTLKATTLFVRAKEMIDVDARAAAS